ncbi:unnamed protein product [Scytosiphon promiscuus]
MDALEAMKGPIGVAFLTMVTVLVVVAGVALCRRLCCKPSVNYTAVNHGLDEEEIAFKNSLEAQHDDGTGRGGDDIDELFNFSGQEELEFDTNDLDNLEMLQMYRTSLGAPPSPRGVETGAGKDGGTATNGRSGGGDARRRNGAEERGGNGALAATVQEAEDLEALLMGGGGSSSSMNGRGMQLSAGLEPA